MMISARRAVLWLVVLAGGACAHRAPEPVELYSEDQCASCRMSIADKSFASEIIDAHGNVFKFDDLGCFEKFRRDRVDLTIGAAFVVDYDSKEWINYRASTIVPTSLKTPMSSGKVAFRDSLRAAEFAKQNPPPQDRGANGLCSSGCCSTGGA